MERNDVRFTGHPTMRRVCAPLTAALAGVMAALLGAAVLAGAAGGSDDAKDGRQAPARCPGALAVVDATILTVTKGVIPRGTVVACDGRISAVGTDVAVPAGAVVVNGAGRFVTPGLIDEHNHIATDAGNEAGTAVSSMTRIQDMLNPTDVNIYRDLAGGVTTACLFHGSANPIGGTTAVIKLRWGKRRPEDFLVTDATPGLKFALGENPKDMRPAEEAFTAVRRYPATRQGVEFVLRDAFTRARRYKAEWTRYAARKKAGDAGPPPRRDLQLEPLVEVLEGKRTARVHAYRVDEMVMMMRLAEEFGFRVGTFEHGLEAYKIAAEIKAHGAGVGTFANTWGYKVETLDGIPYNAAMLVRAGVLTSLNSDGAERARRLNTEAARTIKWGGLSEEEALSLVTINPARQLGVDHRLGSLEIGKDADLVVWNAPPLSAYAVVDRVFIDGAEYYNRQADLRRVEAERAERERLIAELGGTAASAPTVSAPGHTAAVPNPAPRPSQVVPNRERALAVGRRSGVIAIRHATVHPVSQLPLERSTVVIRDGIIAAVGPDVDVPTEATEIDATGLHVYPGWINGLATNGLAEAGLRGYGFEDLGEIGDFNPQLRTAVAFHAQSDSIPIARSNGITTVVLAPPGGILGGQVAVMNLAGRTWEECAVAAAAGSVFSWPLPGGVRADMPPEMGPAPPRDRSFEDLRRERDAKLDDLAALIERARAYAKAGPDRDVDWVLESLVPVAEGRVPLFTMALAEPHVREALAFLDRVGVRGILATFGPHAVRVAPLLRARDIPVVLLPVLLVPPSDDMFHAATFTAPAELAMAGVRFAFATGQTADTNELPYHAAMTVAWGLPHEQAIRALTLDAAEIFGVADILGSIEPGKLANLVVARGDPLEPRTEITHVFIAGRDVGVDNRQRSLYQLYSPKR